MNEPIRILFVTSNPNKAEEVISGIRSNGHAVRPDQVATAEDLAEALESHRSDVVVLIERGSDLTPAQVDAQLLDAGRSTPLLVMTDRPEEERVADYEMGAYAAIGHDSNDLARILVVRAREHFLVRQKQVRAETQLQEAEKRCAQLLDNSRDAIAYVHEGMHLYANESWRERFGIEDPDDVEGLPLMDLVAPGARDDLKAFMRKFQVSGNSGSVSQVMRLQSYDGEEFETDVRLSAANVDGEDCIQVLLGAGEEDPALAGKADFFSQRDQVTGMYNRHFFAEMVEAAHQKSAASEKPFALVTLAVDGFTEIRANIGLSTSDLLLAEIGNMIDEHFGDPSVTARMEGEHFGLLIPDTRRGEVEERVLALMGAVSGRIFDFDGSSVECTLSAGAVIADEASSDAECLLSLSDKALQDSVASEGPKVCFFRPEEGEITQVQSDQQWASRIKEAIDQGGLELMYEPIVNIHGTDRPRYSVSVRLKDADGEIHDSSAFVPSAERTGLAASLDRWTLKASLKALADQMKGNPSTLFFLKLSAGSLVDQAVLGWLKEDLGETTVPPENVAVEFKEAAVAANLAHAREVASGLREMEVGMCISEFGGGLDPLRLLQHVEADHLKLDASFTEGLASGGEGGQVEMEEISKTAQEHGKKLIVPCVENADVLADLYRLNLGLVQGRFFRGAEPSLDFEFA